MRLMARPGYSSLDQGDRCNHRRIVLPAGSHPTARLAIMPEPGVRDGGSIHSRMILDNPGTADSKANLHSL